MPHSLQLQPRRRAGISLLEVLISVGVLSIGLLGAASLLPLAKYYSVEASKYNRAGSLGQQSLHDLQIRGFLSPKKWIDANGGFNVNSSALVLDPLAMSYAAANGQPQPVYFPAFPYTQVSPPPPSVPALFRSNLDISDSWPDHSDVPLAANPLAMPYPEADRLFRANDDLIFDLPSNADDRPRAPNGTLAPDFSGDYSYFLTLSHTPADIANAQNMQRYLVSIVVCYKRDLTLWQSGLAPGDTPPERLVYADFLQAAATNVPFYGGGGLYLRTNNGKEWLEGIKPNTYLMLCANFVDAAAGPNGYPKFAWYRIVSVDGGPEPVSGQAGFFGRVVNVTGADWAPVQTTDPVSGAPLQLWYDAQSTGAPSPPYAASSPEPATVFAVLVSDAIAVYDHVITIDNSLLRR